MSRIPIWSAVFIFVLYGAVLAGSDADANAFLLEADAQKQKGEFAAAGARYLDAAHMADTPLVRANAIQNAAVCYRNAKLYGKEFDCIERLLKEHLAFVDFDRAVSREYEIANDFYNGHRDVIVSWLPFIKDADRTEEIYQAALKHAACAGESPEARLRLGRIFQERNMPDKAIFYYKEILALHPETSAARYAWLELCGIYIGLAEKGDGDGKWTRLAMTSLKDFLAAHPDDPEVPWAKKELERIHAIEAKRIHNIGRYYHRTGRDDLAQRYLVRVIRDHGATKESIPSEKLLAEIDKTYEPPPEDAERTPEYVYTFQRKTIPVERNPIMVVPENSDGKWLLPIRNLSPDISLDSRHDVPPRKVDTNEF